MLLLLCARLTANRRRRRNPTGDAVRKVGDSVTWERFPTVADYNQPSRDSFNFGLKHALVELSMGACAIANLPAQLLDDLPLLERLHLWGNLLEFELGVLRPTRREMYVIAGRVVLAIRDAILTCARKLTRVSLNRPALGPEHPRRRPQSRRRGCCPRGNLLETLPRDLFRYSARMTELLLWGNRIDELDAAAFDARTFSSPSTLPASTPPVSTHGRGGVRRARAPASAGPRPQPADGAAGGCRGAASLAARPQARRQPHPRRRTPLLRRPHRAPSPPPRRQRRCRGTAASCSWV